MLNWKNSYIPKYHPLYAGINCTIKYQVKSLPVHSITLFPLTKNQPFDYFHRHAGYAFIDFALVFKAYFQHLYFYCFATVGFSGAGKRLPRGPGRHFLTVFLQQQWTDKPGTIVNLPEQKCPLPDYKSFSYRTHRVDRSFDPVFYSFVFYIIYI